jgi:septum formation protein
VNPSSLSEEKMPHPDPVEAAKILALHKAREVASRVSEGIILGADTLVHLDGWPFGKPKDVKMAREYLQALSGKIHQVTTGLALVEAKNGREEMAEETTKVKMHDLSEEEIESYLESGEPFDKAGAYAIQGKGFILIDKIWGCYTNVVGLPVGRLRELMQRFGTPVYNCTSR